MRLLLDTQAWLWYVLGDHRLSPTAQTLLADGSNERVLSIASCWEVAIKVSIGKYSLNAPFFQFMERGTQDAGVGVLGINAHHLDALTRLPLHHLDPFDRLILSQAIADGLQVVSSDGEFSKYGVNLIW
jgi:PIN domain nuclease of toxin-antitoxin system